MIKKLILALIAATFIAPAFAVTVEIGDSWHDWKWREHHRAEWRAWHRAHSSDWITWRRDHDEDRWCFYHPRDC